MPHIGFLVPPFFGHLRPMSVLARAVQGRGHRVSMLTFADGLPFLAGSGLNVVPFGSQQFPAEEWNRRSAAMGSVEGRQVSRLALDLLLDQARAIFSELPTLITKLGLDGLVMDQLCYSAEGVAEACATPLVVACNAMPLHRESAVPLCFRHWRYNPALWARARNRLDGALNLLWGWRMSLVYVQQRRALGLSLPTLSDLNEVPPSLAQIAQLPEFLDFPRKNLPAHFHHTGPWLEEPESKPAEFPWHKLDDRPLVYAALGTLQNRVERLYRIIAAACDGLPVQLIIGLGRAGQMDGLAGSPLVVGFAPQRQLLSRAALMISHAGLNSSLESLSAGVPLVAIPLAHEQPGVAARLKRAGVAAVVPPKLLTCERLSRCVEHACSDAGLRQRARHVAAQLRELNGPDRAAEIIEAAVVSRSKVRRRDAHPSRW